MIGNHAVQRLLQANRDELQAGLTRAVSSYVSFDFNRISTSPPATGAMQEKLAINQPGDEYEQEADRISDHVTATSAHNAISGGSLGIQRLSEESAGRMDAAPPSVGRALASPGNPLKPALRQDMEQRFGYDFSRVRVHSGQTADQSAQDMHAQAYTVGHHIVFAAGRFAPEMQEGRRLLAHELTHVVHQSASPASSPRVQCDEGGQFDREERRARREERRTERGKRSELGLRGSLTDSDWAGRMILAQYLYGGGKTVDVFDDPDWTKYMEASDKLRDQNWVHVTQMARDLAKQSKDGRFPAVEQYHAEVENGESMIGYQLLHGTNRTVGDFRIYAFGDVKHLQQPSSIIVPGEDYFSPPRRIDRQPGVQVDLDLTFVWNDVVDPNEKYWSDIVKSAIAEYITLGGAESYNLSIHWRSSCSVFVSANGGLQLTGGYPRL
jgi:hypothetical protein